jgi:exodeoxyribonuclease-5
VKGKKHKADAIREDPFFNALQIKFAYAVTCHKAQGGQWKHVYIDQGFIQPDALDSDYYRWLYTAITRATEKLFLINFRSEFLDK